MNNIFDSHAHYTDSVFDIDRNKLLPEMNAEGVKHIMLAAVNINDSMEIIKLTENYDFIYGSVGIHPEYAESIPKDYAERLRKLANHKKICAIGEIGLDYHYDGYNKEKQISLFENQLNLAKELKLPVIIHCRDAYGDCMDILRKHMPIGIMHCFSGSAETAEEIIKLGMYIGFTGVITFKNAKKALRALKVIPKEKLLLETDCPYMAPEPKRGSRSDSTMIQYTAAKAGEIKGISAQEMLDLTCQNAERLFNI